MSWHADIFTLYPQMFPGQLGLSLHGKALEKGLWSFNAINIREYAYDARGSVDDSPFGGGAGMVMRPDVLGDALDAHLKKDHRVIYMSPRGKRLDQPLVRALSQESNLAIICGRYEGVDERIIDAYEVEEVSVGDYVLSGGESAALVMMEACIRLLPGVLGNDHTFEEESFGENEDYSGLLEYPLYTRPSEWKGRPVPEVLLSGHHERIDLWRKQQSEAITKKRRQDLWQQYLKRGQADG